MAGEGKRCLPGVNTGSATILAEGVEAAARPQTQPDVVAPHS